MTPEKYEKFRRVVVWIARLYFVYMAYMLLHPRPPVPRPLGYIPSFLHIGAFGVLGGLVALSRQRWSSRRWLPWLLIWGITSESLQPFTGRYFEWIDMGQNVVGVTLGLWITTWFRAKYVEDSTFTPDPPTWFRTKYVEDSTVTPESPQVDVTESNNN